MTTIGKWTMNNSKLVFSGDIPFEIDFTTSNMSLEDWNNQLKTSNVSAQDLEDFNNLMSCVIGNGKDADSKISFDSDESRSLEEE